MYRSLDADKIINATAELQHGVEQHFPDSDLKNMAAELCEVAREAISRCKEFIRPHLPLRIAIGSLVFGIFIILLALIFAPAWQWKFQDVGEFVQTIEAGLNEIVLIGAGIYFLVTYERRLKRERALKAIHELRSMAHIVDLHQLAKDPPQFEADSAVKTNTPSMSRIKLTRYLDDCCEILSMISIIGAFYVQKFSDPVVLAAVTELESLCSGITNKIWQKILATSLPR